MLRRLKDNLHRQGQALKALHELLQEEFSHLLGGEPQMVSAVEFSVQELMRQLVTERAEARRMVRLLKPEARRIVELYPDLPAEEAEALRSRLSDIDATEQACAMQAAQNHMLANALHEQSRRLIDFMRAELTPKRQDVYCSTGRFAGARNESQILRGRY